MRTQLRAQDHTRVVKFIEKNPLLILAALKPKKFVKKNETPTGRDLLKAAATSSEIEPATKHSIKKALRVLPYLNKQQKYLSPNSRREVKKIVNSVKRAKNVQQIKSSLIKLQKNGKIEQNDELRQSIDLSLSLLKNGRNDIYPGRETVFEPVSTDIVKGAVIGCVTGAAGGAAASGHAGGTSSNPVSVATGVAGAISGSAGAASFILWKWIFR